MIKILLCKWYELINFPENKITYEKNSNLELNDPLLWETKVHPVGVLHVERALVQLRDRIVGVQNRHLFVHLSNDQPKQMFYIIVEFYNHINQGI